MNKELKKVSEYIEVLEQEVSDYKDSCFEAINQRNERQRRIDELVQENRLLKNQLEEKSSSTMTSVETLEEKEDNDRQRLFDLQAEEREQEEEKSSSLEVTEYAILLTTMRVLK